MMRFIYVQLFRLSLTYESPEAAVIRRSIVGRWKAHRSGRSTNTCHDWSEIIRLGRVSSSWRISSWWPTKCFLPNKTIFVRFYVFAGRKIQMDHGVLYELRRPFRQLRHDINCALSLGSNCHELPLLGWVSKMDNCTHNCTLWAKRRMKCNKKNEATKREICRDASHDINQWL